MTNIPDLTLTTYQPNGDKKEENHQIDGFSLCCVGNMIYLVGGGNKMRGYNPFINQWHTPSELLKPRDDPCVCTLNNSIFLMGGDRDDFTTYEIKDITNGSRKIGSLENDSYGIVEIGNKIYAVPDELADDSSVMVYDINEGMISI